MENFDKLVTFQTHSTTSDSAFGVTDSWSDSFDDWMALWPMSAKKVIEAAGGATKFEITHRGRMWYREDVSGRMRLKWGSRYFEVIGTPIDPDEERLYIDLVLREITSEVIENA